MGAQTFDCFLSTPESLIKETYFQLDQKEEAFLFLTKLENVINIEIKCLPYVTQRNELTTILST